MDTVLTPAKAILTARAISLAMMGGLCLGASALSGCDQAPTSADAQPHVDNFVAYVKSIRVEDDGTAPATPQTSSDPWHQGAEILMRTGEDLTTGKGGLISMRPKFEIQVISAAEARKDADTQMRPALDVRPESDASVMPVPVSPDDDGGAAPPLMKPALTSTRQPPLMKPALTSPVAVSSSVATAPAKGRLIQIGAFSSLEAAQGAMKRLIATHPQLAALKAQVETVDTVEGKRVRLKLGPIADEAEATRLCQTLSATDNWCLRAS